MPRPRQWPPKIHSRAGRDSIRIDGRTIALGPTGSERSASEYARWLAVLAANGGHLPSEAEDLSVEECLAKFFAEAAHAKREPINYRCALRPLRELFGSLMAKDFGPKSLKVVRTQLGARYCRRVANRHLVRLKTCFKWLQSEELVPAGLYHDLLTVRGLEPGEARESEPTMPVSEADLQATLPYLSAQVRAAVEVQLLTAARSGEVLGLRPCDLQRGERAQLPHGLTLSLAGVWVCVLGSHKTAHRGHTRVLLFGPRAQAVLSPLLAERQPDAFLFSPKEALADWRAKQRQERQTPVQPSQLCRRKPRPKKQPGDRYTVFSYRQAIARACARAGVPVWHPHQLRHMAASNLVRDFGWDVARIVLGHRQVQTTQLYALDNLRAAVEAMEKAG